MPRRIREVPWTEIRNDTHYVFWYDRRAKRVHRKSLRTRDARIAALRFAEFLAKTPDSARSSYELTVAQALNDYLDEHAERNVTDLTRQRGIVRHLLAFFGDTYLAEVDVILSQKYYQERIAKVVPTTIRRELGVLAAAAKHAIWMGRTEHVIQLDLPPATSLGQDDEAPYLTEDEHRALLAEALATDKELWAFEMLLYHTGARRKSIETLTKSQICIDATPNAREHIVLQKMGKRATKKRQPIVPIFNAMREPLLWLLKRAKGRERLFTKSSFYAAHLRLAESVGIGEGRRHPHVVRHTRATHLLQKGKTLFDVAKLLGDTVGTIEKVYGHCNSEHLKSRLDD